MEIDLDVRDWDREIEERIIQRIREYIQYYFLYFDYYELIIVEICIYIVCVEFKKLIQGLLCLVLLFFFSWVCDLYLQLKIFYFILVYFYYLFFYV